MINYDFWEDWKNKTEIEEQAIEVVIKARNLIIKSVPKKVLVAIYIKGSFIRRELRKGSDIDMVPIVTQTKYEGQVFSVNSSEIHPVEVVPLSIEEFEQNKLLTEPGFRIDLRAEPDLFLKKLSEYKLIYE